LASQFCQTVGDNLFSPPHIDLRVGKLHLLPNKKCKTVGVALNLMGFTWIGKISAKNFLPPLFLPLRILFQSGLSSSLNLKA
jgi:hypothetical protein